MIRSRVSSRRRCHAVALFTFAMLLATAGAARAQAPGVSSTRLAEVSQAVQRMCEVTAVSSHEQPLSRRIASLLPPGLSGSLDSRGNLVVEVGSGGPVMTFIAHQDEVGYEVKGVEADGRLTLTRKGTFYESLFEGHPVIIQGGAGPVPAVLAPRPGYLDAGTGREVSTDDLRLDVGTDSWAATGQLGVRAGDPVTVPKDYERLGATMASARSLDDRVGCATFLLALQRLRTERLTHKVRFVFSVEEELGLVGADFAARAEAGAVCFPVDMFVTSDSPLESRQMADAPLGRGCVIRAVDASVISRRWLVERVLRVAREAHVPVQTGVTGGGNDGARYVTEGAAVVPLAYPMRYSHSAAEVVDLRDVAALCDLVVALAKGF